ncbi:MAG: peptidoglycan editing factor PgeF [Methylococcaceae bacterium]|nr:peptidoglycan editing factor PgeF [Methylococcaceae bacterium]
MNDYFIEPHWPVSSDIHAVTTLRAGGFSRGAYASMNPASHVGDNPLSVLRNRKILINRLGLPAEPVWLKQEHGIRVINAGLNGCRSADASFTFEKGVVCAVLTADCLPVLLCNPITGAVAAVHAGWRGLLLGVIEAALDVIGDSQVAWLGPAIGPDAFVVGSEVRDRFLAKSPAFGSAFKAADDQKWLLDLYSVARMILSEKGVRFIGGGEWCTYSDPERFFSYRRDGACGRLSTLIWRE